MNQVYSEFLDPQEVRRISKPVCVWLQRLHLVWNIDYKSNLFLLSCLLCVTNISSVHLRAKEIFDEFEEWQLIMAHYCIVVAGNQGADFQNAGSVWIKN